ncbi:MAG: PAS domain S-box protein [bacterium]
MLRILKNIKFSKFDSQTEVEFIQDYNEKSIPILRFSLILMFSASLLFNYLDFFAIPISREFIWLIRGIFIELVIIILYAISYTKMIRRYYQTIVSLSSMFMGIGSLLTAVACQPSELGYYSYYAGAILIFICFISLRLRFYASMIVISTIIICYILVVVVIHDSILKEYKVLMEPIFINNIFFLAGAGLAVVVAIYLLEGLARRNFLQKKKIISDMHLKTELDEIKIIESALRESEEKYRTLIDNANEAIIVAQDNKLRFVNPKTEIITGYSSEELTSKPFLEFIHPGDRNLVGSNYLKRLRNEEIPNHYQFRIINKSGEEIWLEISAVLIQWQGKPATLNFLTDITERKEIEEALKENEEKFRTISDSAQDAIIMIDNHGNISFWNKAAEKIFGYCDMEIFGKNFHKLFVPDRFLEAHRTAFKDFQHTGTGAAVGKTLELSAIRKNGEEFPVELSLSSIKLRGNWHAVGIARDITERKKAEEELKNITGTKDKFYSIIAHDLRGPMGTLMKLSALLSDEFDTFDIEDRNLFLKEIKESSENVYHLLENLLTWSRSQKGVIEFNPEELNLHNLVEHVLKTQRLVAATKKILITSTIPEDIVIIADENMLKTIIRNFIGNSIKFTPEDGNIMVNQKAIDGFIQISVTDNGIGMDEETLNKLFKIDEHQSSDGTAGEKGTGLGLILCKEFVEKHGGKVFVESGIDRGSTFSFTIPAVKKLILKKH